jgi:hypothetical protein
LGNPRITRDGYHVINIPQRELNLRQKIEAIFKTLITICDFYTHEGLSSYINRCQADLIDGFFLSQSSGRNWPAGSKMKESRNLDLSCGTVGRHANKLATPHHLSNVRHMVWDGNMD